MLNQIIFIVGPTAAGKSEVAVYLAKKIGGEIISCDAMQVYKEVSVINNKPSLKAQRAIPHHLVGTVSIKKNFDVAAYRLKAVRAINAIHRKNKIPVIVGGSGLYMSILLDGIFKGVSRNEKLRHELEDEAKLKGGGQLHEKLKRLDPPAAQRIHPNDTKRIIRALEVCLVSKKPISTLQKKRQGLWGKFDVKIFSLNRDRQDLYDSINERVEWMVKEGAVQEVEGLLHKKWSRTAESIIGVKEIKGFLSGAYDLERAKYLMKLHTRHLAKRQLTWFRRESRLQWVMMNDDETPAQTAGQILKMTGDLWQKKFC